MHEDCRLYAERISEFLDNELDLDTARSIQEHLQSCEHCRHCIQSLQKTIELLQKSPQEPVPEEVRQRLQAKLRSCLQQNH